MSPVPPSGPLGRTAACLDWAIDRLGAWTAWLALALVLLVATDVILRYLFSIGPVSLQELEWHLISPIALIGMVYAMRHEAHVRVDVFYERFSRRVQLAVDLASALATVAISVVIIAMSLNFVVQAYQIGEGSPDPGGLPYRFLLKAFIPVGFGLLLVQAVAQALRKALELASGSAADG